MRLQHLAGILAMLILRLLPQRAWCVISYPHLKPLNDFVQQADHNAMAEGADGITHPDGNHAMTNGEEEEAKFEIDIDDPIVKKACFSMMKDAVRRRRYQLKKDYFNPYPLHLVSKTSPVKSMDDTQWIALVESWKSPQKMTEMENELYAQTGPEGTKGTEEGEGPLGGEGSEGEENKGSKQPMFVNEVVHGVLSKKTKKNKFLQNVGIQIVQPASMEQNPPADLAAESAELRAVINTQHAQLEELSKELQEAKELRIKDREEMRKMRAEMNAQLELVLSQVRPQ
ncbi:hypothetical protein HU200_050665 [Digitaria exilis]|uniref:Uncharacterized protein n=1 Tax=Digitaria exilis TaxID=1010633 RepID=A0A835ARW8_9POAL|nr:hypothetical protein HU200_050665 [Digitaria exilis]